ncbi:MAG: metalloregulator ArsR/SmtB family transcription factor [Chloroflexi bacterium]|nr:metalloregulator ArsR/SmtB family transcription factor [Chloroflexota bacterium]
MLSARRLCGRAAKVAPGLGGAEAEAYARLLKALADETRLRILSLLSKYEGEVCVCEIGENFALGQPTISHHLRILREAGLISGQKRGPWVYYFLNREKGAWLKKVLAEVL